MLVGAGMALKRIYFAHPIITYYSRLEYKALEAIKRKYPKSEIDNPSKYPSNKMSFYLERVRIADCIIFMANHRGFIGKGVFDEINYAEKLNKEVLYYNFERNLFTYHFKIQGLSEVDWENYAIIRDESNEE